MGGSQRSYTVYHGLCTLQLCGTAGRQRFTFGNIPRIGMYDKWAIEWGYRWMPEYETAEAEIPHLNKWIIEKLREDKRYTFGTELDRNDPRNQSEDLGDDAMLASSYGIKT